MNFNLRPFATSLLTALTLAVSLGARSTAVFSAALLSPVAAHAKSQKANKAVNKAKRGVKAKVGKSSKAVKASKLSSKSGSWQKVKVKRGGRWVWKRVRVAPLVFVPPVLSFGQKAGLHATADPLELKSSVALVLDQDTNEVLVSKNDRAVLPIASLTKLMTALVLVKNAVNWNEVVAIQEADVDTVKKSKSRLAVGTALSRRELLHLALMSSENRAAAALARTWPQGSDAFVRLMNLQAAQLGMRDTRFVDATGLSSSNQSSAADLAALVKASLQYPELGSLSTSLGASVDLGHKIIDYRNTNQLVHSPNWEIGLQKTGFISEAGRCLVMQTKVAGRRLIMVFLDSAGLNSRLGDAQRVRNWLEGS